MASRGSSASRRAGGPASARASPTPRPARGGSPRGRSRGVGGGGGARAPRPRPEPRSPPDLLGEEAREVVRDVVDVGRLDGFLLEGLAEGVDGPRDHQGRRPAGGGRGAGGLG